MKLTNYYIKQPKQQSMKKPLKTLTFLSLFLAHFVMGQSEFPSPETFISKSIEKWQMTLPAEEQSKILLTDLAALHSSNIQKTTTNILLDSINHYAYDELNDHFANTRQSMYRYNEAGQLIEEVRSDDSSLFPNRNKFNYLYDALGYRTQIIVSRWSYTQNEWQYDDKRIYEYDQQGNSLKFIYYEWDTENHDWQAQIRISSIYTPKNKLAKLVHESFNASTKEWENMVQLISTYKEGIILQSVVYIWQTDWIFAFKDEYEYNNDNLILYTTYNCNTDSCLFNEQTKYNYNIDNALIEEIRYYWEQTLDSWQPTDKMVWDYDVNSTNVIKHLISEWDTDLSKWVPSLQYSSEFNSQNQRTSYITASWNEGKGIVVDDTKITYAYDEMNNLQHTISYNWNKHSKIWEAFEKRQHIYNQAYDCTAIVAPPHFCDTHNTIILQELKHTWNNNDWLLSGQVDYHYSDPSLVITSNSLNATNTINQTIQVYPNPSTDIVYFNLGKTQEPRLLQIYNLNGQELLVQKLVNQEPIDLGHLTSGLYFYRVVQKDIIYKGKIVME